MPTTSRTRPLTTARNTLAPEPAKSHTLNKFAGPVAVAGAAHQVTVTGCVPQARRHASRPAPRNDQRGVPVRMSNATTELVRASAGKQDSLQPPGAALRQASTVAGCVYGCPAAA